MKPIRLLAWLIGATTLMGVNAARGSENWPGFRGPSGLGYTDEKSLPVEWGGPTDKNVLWKVPLKGQGHASPIVWGDAVVTCTVNWPAGVERATVVPEQHVTCYRARDGKELWDTLVPAGPWLRTDFRSGPGGGYAAATPATDGKLIYCAFASSIVAAIDFTGHIAWKREIVPFTFDVTFANSPVLYNNTVVIFCPSAKSSDSRLLALDKVTGVVKWQHDYPSMGFGHSTPVLITVKGKPQLLLLASGMGINDKALLSVDPTNGDVIWSCRGGGDASSPAYDGTIVYFDSGRGGLGVAVSPTGAGDITKSHTQWTVGGVPEGLSSPIIVGKYVYRLVSPGAIKCWEAATGKEMYSERLEGLTSTWASPIADGAGRLFIATAGKSYIIQSGPTFKVLGTSDLGDANHPSPAVALGRIYLEGLNKLYCIGKR